MMECVNCNMECVLYNKECVRYNKEYVMCHKYVLAKNYCILNDIRNGSLAI